jgi:hypothetical protein
MSHDAEAKQASLDRIHTSGVLPGQIYRHYKSGNTYTVVAVGLNESDLEPLVHYRAVDDPAAIVWTRLLHVFTGRVLDNGLFVTRFARVN